MVQKLIDQEFRISKRIAYHTLDMTKTILKKSSRAESKERLEDHSIPQRKQMSNIPDRKIKALLYTPTKQRNTGTTYIFAGLILPKPLQELEGIKELLKELVPNKFSKQQCSKQVISVLLLSLTKHDIYIKRKLLFGSRIQPIISIEFYLKMFKAFTLFGTSVARIQVEER